jgi:hypothetical protein
MADIYGPVLEKDLNMTMDDVWNVVSLAYADENPFTGLVKPRRKVRTQLHSTPIRDNGAPRVTAAQDGERQTFFSGSVAEQIYWQTQEMREAWSRGRQTVEEKTYPKDEMIVTAKREALRRLMKQVEIVSSSTQTIAVQTASVRPKTRGAFEITDAVGGTFMSSATHPIPDKFRSKATYRGALADFTSAALQEMLMAMSIAYGGALDLVGLVGPRMKAAMSNFAAWPERDPQASGPYDVSIRKEKRAIDNVVDVFKFDAGTVRTMLSYNLARDVSTPSGAERASEYGSGAMTDATPQSGLFLDIARWRWSDTFSLEHVEGTDFGNGANGFYRVMQGLVCDNPITSAHAYCTTPAPTP